MIVQGPGYLRQDGNSAWVCYLIAGQYPSEFLFNLYMDDGFDKSDASAPKRIFFLTFLAERRRMRA